MGSDPSIRASDRDRDRTAQLLSAHHSAGRLDAEEFAERLDLVYVAKTVDDLDELTADLPAIDLYPLPSASLPRSRAAGSGLPASSLLSGGPGGSGVTWPGRAGQGAPAGQVALWGSWSLIMAVGLILWAVSGNPWPLLWAAAAGVVIGGQRVVRRALGHGGGTRPSLGEGRTGSIEDRDDEG